MRELTVLRKLIVDTRERVDYNCQAIEDLLTSMVDSGSISIENANSILNEVNEVRKIVELSTQY